MTFAAPTDLSTAPPPPPQHHPEHPRPRRTGRLIAAAGVTLALALPGLPAAAFAAGSQASPSADSTAGATPADATPARAAQAKQAALGTIPTSGLLADYSFAQASGNEVANRATDGVGPAQVRQSAANQWSGDSLRFNGGAKSSTSATWVEWPANTLSKASSATITTEVKIDASMKSANHFLWNVGNSATNEYFFATTRDAPRTAITTSSNPGEKNARATAPLAANRWYSLTTVLDGDAGTISLYVDGERVGSGATSLKPSDISDQSLNTLGRAPWPDPFFKGEVSTFRVYDRALDAGEVSTVSAVDAQLHADSLTGAATGVLDQIGEQLTVTDSSTVLPSPGGAITWSSQDPELTVKNGTLSATQPAADQPALTGELTATASVRGVTASKQVKVAVQPLGASDSAYGYLMVHFIEDSEGYAEKIYLDISRGDDPEQWDPLNGGKPILASDLGTTGLRDPFLTFNPETGTYYIIATDLRVFGGDKGTAACNDWCHWSSNGSPRFMVWESTDLISWSDMRQLDIRLDASGTPAVQPGMAWAPEATWVPDFNGAGQGAFVLYWSSKLSDGGKSYSRILWGSTSDFTQESYRYGGVFVDAGGETIDTTMIQDRGTTYRITKDNAQGKGIYMESTPAQQWWLPATTWKTVQTKMGASWAGGNAGGVEGPAVFKRHDDERWYLYVDVIPTTGYRPMTTTDLSQGFEVLNSGSFHMAPSTKHGGIINLSRERYDAVRAADATSVVTKDLGEVDLDAAPAAGRTAKKLATRAGDPVAAALPATAEVNTAYGRGTAQLPISWDTAGVDTSTPGSYPVTGTVLSVGANLNDWVGDGGSLAYDAPGKTLRSTTALTVSASVRILAAETESSAATPSVAPSVTPSATPSATPTASATATATATQTPGESPSAEPTPGQGTEPTTGPGTTPGTAPGSTPDATASASQGGGGAAVPPGASSSGGSGAGTAGAGTPGSGPDPQQGLAATGIHTGAPLGAVALLLALSALLWMGSRRGARSRTHG